MARSIPLAPRRRESWQWAVPSADLTAREYGQHIMRNARRYQRDPDALPYNVSRYGCELRPVSAGGGDYNVGLVVMIGSGWGGQTRCTVATWEGGKRWTLTGLNGAAAREAVDTLCLPESDGRYLLRDAPPRPAKGVGKWRARWTVGRRELAGLTAVAGEGIDPSAVRKRMENAVEQHAAQARSYTARYEEARAELAALRPMTEVAIEYGRLRARLLRYCAITADDATSWHVTNRDWKRQHERHSKRCAAIFARAEERAAPYTNDPTPIKFGVRMTLSDGTPRHRHGPFAEAHKLGVDATAPDWTGEPRCGAGLHFIPLRNDQGDLRDIPQCVQWAMGYGSTDDFALWIVRASENRVMIDGHKAKAETLTPVEYIGAYTTRTSAHSRIIDTLKAFEDGQQRRDGLRGVIDSCKRNAALHTKNAENIAATLRDWRKAGKA